MKAWCEAPAVGALHLIYSQPIHVSRTAQGTGLGEEVAIKELIPALVRVRITSQCLDTVSPCIPDRSRG